MRGRHLSPKQLGGSRDCSSADVFPPSRQDESIAEDELIPVEGEGEKQRSEEEEEVEVEGQSEGDVDEEEEGKGSEVIEQADRKTKSGVEMLKVRDEMEERKTPDSDKTMKRYIDQVEISGEEDEEERREKGENECDAQSEVAGETEEDSDEVGEEKEVVERCGAGSEEQRDEADGCRSERDETSLKEDERVDEESAATKMSESEDEEMERLKSVKESTDTSLRQKSMLGKKTLSCCGRPSEVRSVTFDPSPPAPCLQA